MDDLIMNRFLILCFAMIFLTSCGGGSGDNSSNNSITLKGNRILSIDITEPGDADFDKAVVSVTDAGFHVTSMALNWGDIETAPGVYDNTLLALANSYYPTKGISISLSLRTINTNQIEIPTDLTATNFDDPVMITRFKQFLDFVFSEIPNLTLSSLSIGNEIDAYLGTDITKWTQYRTFYETVSAYARTKRSDLKVGTKATFGGMTGSMSSQLDLINTASDVIMVTYYPLNSDFTVKDPGIVSSDFQMLAKLYPLKPIYLMELGYPSGAACNSSESKQDDFIKEVFSAWDTYNSQIQLISFTWLNDLSPQTVQDLTAYYGINDASFYEYLATLGLRTHSGSGSDKQAFITLKDEVSKRGW